MVLRACIINIVWYFKSQLKPNFSLMIVAVFSLDLNVLFIYKYYWDSDLIIIARKIFHEVSPLQENGPLWWVTEKAKEIWLRDLMNGQKSALEREVLEFMNCSSEPDLVFHDLTPPTCSCFDGLMKEPPKQSTSTCSWVSEFYCQNIIFVGDIIKAQLII